MNSIYKKLYIRKIRNENKQEKTEIHNVERHRGPQKTLTRMTFFGIYWIHLWRLLLGEKQTNKQKKNQRTKKIGRAHV